MQRVQDLLQQGADPNLKNPYDVRHMSFCMFGVDLFIMLQANGNTPLHAAARHSNSVEIMTVLIDAGAPVDAVNAVGN